MQKEMTVSEVQIKIIKPSDGLIGFASLVVNEQLYVSSIGIYTLLDGSGYRLTYPTKKVGDVDLHIFHPITRQLSDLIEGAILEKLSLLFGDSYVA
ncbi:MAG: hypothetical protein ACD_22C00128G0001 [uncultured bacterium]|nr:MAG: hypothetical protein ACD_22C00128G0001 [uncultured bacterium]